MRYVLDSCVALKWVLRESDSAKAIRIRNEFVAEFHELLAPDIFPVEIGHALAKAERRGLVSTIDGVLKLSDVLSTLPLLHRTLPDLLPRAYALASAARIGVYDCLYVALADREGCRFVTADRRLINSLGVSHPFIVDLSTF